MAKGKGKGVASSGPRKSHGPKRKLFHCWSSTMRKHFADAGLLKKEYNYESFCLACAAKGKRSPTRDDFSAFVKLEPNAKKEYFRTLGK